MASRVKRDARLSVGHFTLSKTWKKRLRAAIRKRCIRKVQKWLKTRFSCFFFSEKPRLWHKKLFLRKASELNAFHGKIGKKNW